jgi:hypothetical protein
MTFLERGLNIPREFSNIHDNYPRWRELKFRAGPPRQMPATFLGVGRHQFLQEQAFFAKKGCLPATPVSNSGAKAGSHFFAEK